MMVTCECWKQTESDVVTTGSENSLYNNKKELVTKETNELV